MRSLLLEEDPRTIQEQLIDYVIYNRGELKIASSSINTKIAPIRKFYECNDIELRWKKIKSYIGRNKGKGGVGRKKDRPYTHKEIAKMLEKADQRGRVAILLMASKYVKGYTPVPRQVVIIQPAQNIAEDANTT